MYSEEPFNLSILELKNGGNSGTGTTTLNPTLNPILYPTLNPTLNPTLYPKLNPMLHCPYEITKQLPIVFFSHKIHVSFCVLILTNNLSKVDA